MQTVQSRLYTNVVLTAIAILLAVLALRPFVSLTTTAMAADRNGLNQPVVDKALAPYSTTGGDIDVANATREVAKATIQVAEAIRQSADAQTAMAKAMQNLTVEPGQ